MVEGQALGNDVRRVVGAMLERGAREQPAHEFGIVGLQVQGHIRGHPELAGDKVGRPGPRPQPVGQALDSVPRLKRSRSFWSQ